MGVFSRLGRRITILARDSLSAMFAQSWNLRRLATSGISCVSLDSSCAAVPGMEWYRVIYKNLHAEVNSAPAMQLAVELGVICRLYWMRAPSADWRWMRTMRTTRQRTASRPGSSS